MDSFIVTGTDAGSRSSFAKERYRKPGLGAPERRPLPGGCMDDPLKDYVLSARRLVMYSDLNASGRLFGGRLMVWMDEACGMTAMRIMMTKRVVTTKFGEVVFDAPGCLGDYVEIWCRPDLEGTTSLTLDCRVLVRTISPEHTEQICRSTVVYVSLNANGRPSPWKQRQE